jgi:hypothetical protein
MALTGSYRFAKILICGSLIISSTAANASASLDPWAALSAFGTQSSRSAACSAATVGAAAAVAAQGAGSGCVLPVTDPPPPPPVVQSVPVPPPPLETGGFGMSPLLLALGALAVAGLIYLVARGDNDDEESLSPQ